MNRKFESSSSPFSSSSSSSRSRSQAKAPYAIGIDLGCSAVKVLAVTAKGPVLAQKSSPIPNHQSHAWKAVVRRAVDSIQAGLGSRPDWIGVAAPGLTGPEQRSVACMPGRLPGLERMVWQDFLEVEHAVPVLNDGHAALLGEVWLGAAKGARNAILLTLGTGVGGAAMVDGRLLRGHLGRAGHLGHISLNPHGPADVANTPGSLEYAIGDYSVAHRSYGRFSNTRDLVTASRKGDPEARRFWLESVRVLGAGIASLVNTLDPEVVVLGGGITQAGAALFGPLKRFLVQFEWRPLGSKVRVVPARLGDRAGAFGAAWRAMQCQGTWSMGFLEERGGRLADGGWRESFERAFTSNRSHSNRTTVQHFRAGRSDP